MIVSGSANALMLGQSSGYNLTKSLRFRASASASLSRTPASSSNRQTWTWSAWVKPSLLAAAYNTSLFGADNGTDTSLIAFTGTINTPTYQINIYNGNGAVIRTTQVFRDPSAWYHIVVVSDTTSATSSNRTRLYINGSQVTAFDSATYPSQNGTGSINSTTQHDIGKQTGTSRYFDGYMAEVNFIDGQALAPSSFGSTNAQTGVWQPAKYTGTYGTNGFYLPFTDVATTSGSNAGLGKDFSGNGNYWTTNNISVTAGTTYDSMTDVPTLTSATTANYCVLNPINSNGTISGGNLDYSMGNTKAVATMAMTAGKFYTEVTVNSASNRLFMLGIGKVNTALSIFSLGVGYYADDGTKYVDGTNSSYGATYTAGDVIGIAVNFDASQVTFYKNNTSQGAISLPSSTDGYTLVMQAASGSTSATFSANFGQRPFSYTPPTGFNALNTYNLPTPTIGATASTQAGKYMNVLTWSGTGGSAGATRSLTGLGFKPDFVWEKARSSTQDHHLFDSVRGAGLNKTLASNSTSGQAGFNDTTFGYLSSFDSDGMTTTNGSSTWDNWNKSGDTYVGWCWQAGQGSTSTNNDGSITSTVSVNASAGFSIVTYTSTTGTVGHGLGVAPTMIIMKATNLSDQWTVGHKDLNGGSSAWNYGLPLNTTAALQTNSAFWNNTAPTSTVFSQGSWDSGYTKVAYCFTPIAGYSAFGSYTGNNSADGPFIYLGFKPKYLMIRNSTSAGYEWTILDSVRTPYNQVNGYLIADGAQLETTGNNQIDIVSNGFKIRQAAGNINPSGGTIIYMAFAENPFKYSLAR